MEEKIINKIRDGSIIKRFDKTPPPVKPTDAVCPHFLELKWATGCIYDCAYCYLNGTLRFLPQKKKPYLKDRNKITTHVKNFLENANGHKELLNTGELADSLMWENNGQPFSKFIISLFSTQKKHKLLFLTKSDYVKNFLEIDGCEQAVISFSLNTEKVAERWEKRTPSVTDRLEAARKVNQVGYETRVRIDPMVPVTDWKVHYTSFLDQIFEKFTPERITLGSLRGLQSTINNSKDKSWVKYLSESSNWGKKIEFNTRYWMYLTVINYLKEKYNYDKVALCKETTAMWQKLGMDYKKIKCNCVW